MLKPIIKETDFYPWLFMPAGTSEIDKIKRKIEYYKNKIIDVENQINYHNSINDFKAKEFSNPDIFIKQRKNIILNLKNEICFLYNMPYKDCLKLSENELIDYQNKINEKG